MGASASLETVSEENRAMIQAEIDKLKGEGLSDEARTMKLPNKLNVQ